MSYIRLLTTIHGKRIAVSHYENNYLCRVWNKQFYGVPGHSVPKDITMNVTDIHGERHAVSLKKNCNGIPYVYDNSWKS